MNNSNFAHEKSIGAVGLSMVCFSVNQLIKSFNFSFNIATTPDILGFKQYIQLRSLSK